MARKRVKAIQNRGVGKSLRAWVRKYERLGFTVVKLRRWSDGTQTVDMEMVITA